MKKFFYYTLGIFSVTTGLSGIYFFTEGNLTLFITSLIECIFSTVLFIMLEERPRNTEIQRRHDDRIKSQGLGICIMTALAVVMLLFMTTSCSRKGYGCHGNQSWNKMIERNNRP